MSDDAFHDHLDKCARCRENPFDLCTAGQILIAMAAADLINLRGKPLEPKDFHDLKAALERDKK